MDKTTVELKYCLYARKSSEQDERQAMSIDSQLNEMRVLAEKEQLNVVEILQESHSAKDSGKRQVYNQLIDGIRNDKYNAVLVWDASRLSRNGGDLGSLVDLMDSGKLLKIQTYAQTFTNNPNEKFLLMILCSQAKLENDNKSINVKRGMKTKLEMGWRPGVAPLGYMNRHFGGVKDIILDPDRAPIITEIYNKAGYHGWSGRKLKLWLDEIGFTNRSGKPIALSQVFLILTNTFYYGEFEYPEGVWFKGSHEPLVSKELFELVQQFRGVNKGKWGSKQFAFRGLLKCGHCGGDVTSEEKFKKLLNGEFNRHVYYRCTKKVDLHCPEKYLNETKLIELMEKFINRNADKLKLSNDLRSEIERHYATTESVLEHYGVTRQLGKPFVEYARFVLNRGTFADKAKLTMGITSTLKIKDGKILLAD